MKMAGKLLMGNQELTRMHVMERVQAGEITLKTAASLLRVSYRQAKRILKRYSDEGAAGLPHRNQGKASNNRIASEVQEQAITSYRQRYHDFGPTFAAEKLAEHEGIAVSGETLRQWLLAEGLWQRSRRSNPYRSRRDRRSCFGELVQFDGSHHDWFEGRRGKCCLMNMVDDARGRSLSMLFEQETTEAAMTLLSSWIRKYGIPQAAYCDRNNAFVSNREPSIQEQLAGLEPRSHFQRACDKLGIQVITARSPQAKGRVERSHGVYQDRFIKELRLAGISTIAEANRFLEET
jgi:transposase